MANSCETCKHYEVEAYNEPCNSCRVRDYDVPTKWESPFKQQKTNAERIRAMSDEELARFLASKFTDETYYRLTKKAHIPTATEIEAIRNYWYDTWLAWLKQPAEVDNG